jgi:hypothetical protein
MSTQLSQIAKKAKLDRTVRFTSLAHLLTPEFLTETWGMMNRRAASGIDGESTEQFESELEQRVEEICAQLRARVSERMCKQVSVSLPYRGDSHDDRHDDYT